MTYLISEIAVCLLLAFLLGCIVGWLLKRVGCARTQAALQAEIERLQEQERQQVQDEAPVVPAATAEPAPLEQPAETPATEPVAAAAVDSVPAVLAAVDPADLESSYDIEEIEGIGSGYGRRLRGMNIETTLDFLNRCEDPSQITAIAEQVGIEQFVVQKWLCMADLLRVPGVRGQYAELLTFSGVQSVEDLAGRKASTLVRELITLNEEENRAEKVPEEDAVGAWIAAAAQL